MGEARGLFAADTIKPFPEGNSNVSNAIRNCPLCVMENCPPFGFTVEG
jgi:hypothetical protein